MKRSEDNISLVFSNYFVMKSFSDVVVGLHGRNEVARNKTGTLMDQLVERVLAVRAGLTPDDGAGGVINLRSGTGDVPKIVMKVTICIIIFMQNIYWGIISLESLYLFDH